MVSVLTVDDQTLFRSAARDVIEATPGFEAVAEAESGEDAVSIVDELLPAVVLLDVRMPGIGGVAAARVIAGSHPEVLVVLVTAEDLESLPAGVDSCGAAAVLRKEDLCPRVLRALWDDAGQPAPGLV